MGIYSFAFPIAKIFDFVSLREDLAKIEDSTFTGANRKFWPMSKAPLR
jgi:hypothetical protein